MWGLTDGIYVYNHLYKYGGELQLLIIVSEPACELGVPGTTSLSREP